MADDIALSFINLSLRDKSTPSLLFSLLIFTFYGDGCKCPSAFIQNASHLAPFVFCQRCFVVFFRRGSGMSWACLSYTTRHSTCNTTD